MSERYLDNIPNQERYVRDQPTWQKIPLPYKKKDGARVSTDERNWPRRLATTVRIREEAIVLARTIALSMPYTERKSIFHACIIRDKRRTDCLMDRAGYLKVLEKLSSISFPILQSAQSPYCVMSRDTLFILEIEEVCGPRRSLFKWKNPDPKASHLLEYIWGLFGRVIQERNPDVRLDDLMPCE